MPLWPVIAVLLGGGGYYHWTQMEKERAEMKAKLDAAEADAEYGRKRAAEADAAKQKAYVATQTGKQSSDTAEGKLVYLLTGKTKATTVPVESKRGLLRNREEEELVRVDDARPDLTNMGWAPKTSGLIRVGTV